MTVSQADAFLGLAKELRDLYNWFLGLYPEDARQLPPISNMTIEQLVSQRAIMLRLKAARQ